MGMAVTEIIFLVGWTGLEFCGDRVGPLLRHLPLTAMQSLGQGMAVAGAFGVLGGLITALAFNIGRPPVGPSLVDQRLRAACQWPDQIRRR